METWGLAAATAQTLTASELTRVGRVVEEQKNSYRVQTATMRLWARPSGRLTFTAQGRDALPSVGDFVLLAAVGDRGGGAGADDAAGDASCDAPGDAPGDAASDGWRLIERLLPRRSQIVRKAAGRVTEAQVIAANVDTVFIATSLNHDFNERRLERYLTMVWSGGALPVLLLTKSDLCEDLAGIETRARAIAAGAPVLPVSAASGAGLDALAPYLRPGQTVALVGSSGVGKSTLVNRLLGDALQSVQDVRESDDRGRHTTTYRSLIRLPGGALLVDTPGMRELMPFDFGPVAGLESGDDEEGGGTFAEVLALAATCRFSDCGHGAEPGCAIKAAVESGDLDPDRLASFEKLRREQAYLERKVSASAASAAKRRWQQLAKASKRHPKYQR